MKEIQGRASAIVDAPLDACFALLEALERYPVWNPDLVREVEVLERDGDGTPATARVMLHVAQGPLAKDFELVVAVRAERPRAILLSRIPNEPSDPERLELAWRLQPDDETRIELDFDAAASSVPGIVPLPRIGDLIARRFLDAAVAALRS
jgi:ribosome-associated toxin RatA of RatAB toxin-antitoxin module